MFAIANPDAPLFQWASGRAPQARRRLLRQHGWALSVRRRGATRLRDFARRAVTARPRPFSGGDAQAALSDGDAYPCAADFARSVRPEPFPLSFFFY